MSHLTYKGPPTEPPESQVCILYWRVRDAEVHDLIDDIELFLEIEVARREADE